MNVIPSAGESAAPAVRSSATIDIRIQRIGQLFDSLDPSPFSENEKALRRDAEDYIADFAGEYGRAEPLRLIVHAPVSINGR